MDANSLESLDLKVSNLSTEMAVQKTSFASLVSSVAQLAGKVDNLANVFANSQRTNWPVYIALAGVVLTGSIATVGACWIIINLEIKVSTTPTDLRIEQIVSNQAGHDRVLDKVDQMLKDLSDRQIGSLESDSQSKADRAQLNVRLAAAESHAAENLADRRAAEAILNERQTESETQIRALEQTRNLMASYQEQLMGIQYELAHPGQHWPARNGYYPEIAHTNSNTLPSTFPKK
jgi:hypothetical protein